MVHNNSATGRDRARPLTPEGRTLTGVGGWEKESFEVDSANIETMKAAPSMKSRHRDWQIVHSMTQP